MRGSAPVIQGLAEDGERFPIDKMEAHRRGIRHVAISAFVFTGERLLLQRRALGKYHSGGQWANTCCSHPGWDESPAVCVRRRVGEEMGLDMAFREVGVFDYAADVGGGLIENEAVHMFAAHVARPRPRPRPDPDEVMATRWVELEALKRDARRQPELYTPWLRIYLEEAWPLLARAA
jgi:isopentenyl-diphosphate delta-isomerase